MLTDSVSQKLGHCKAGVVYLYWASVAVPADLIVPGRNYLEASSLIDLARAGMT